VYAYALAALCLLVGVSAVGAAQTPSGTIVVDVRVGEQPIEGAEVILNGLTYRTDRAGAVRVQAPSGPTAVTVVKDGFVPTTTMIQAPASGEQRVLVDLQPLPTLSEEIVVVSSTRTDRGLDDQPLRVDVLLEKRSKRKC
jgi:hypothetical protein